MNVCSSVGHMRKLLSKQPCFFLLLPRRPHRSCHGCCCGTISKCFKHPFFLCLEKKRVAGFINPKRWGLSVFILSLVHFKGRRTQVRFPLWRSGCLFLIHHCGTSGNPLSFWFSVSFTLLTRHQCCKTAMNWYAWKMYKCECLLASLLTGVFSLSLIPSFDRYLF